MALTARFSEERISVEGMTLTGWMGYRGRGGGGPKAVWFELAGVGQEEHRAAGLLRSHMPVFPPPPTLSTEWAHHKYLSGV